MERILSTYRLQLHKDFRFDDLENILSYLKDLGISTIYASPIFTAVNGSNHGYDILDPNSINPEMGETTDFENLAQKVRDKGMNWLQDIVPNHMAFAPENPWILNILETGNRSVYSEYFDIAWDHTSFPGRLMLPFLGKNAEEAVKDGEIRLILKEQKLFLAYYDMDYPVQPKTYSDIISQVEPKSETAEQFLLQLKNLHHVEDKNIFQKQWQELVTQFAALLKHDETAHSISDVIEKINKDPGALLSVVEDQHYRLCHWQETDAQINFRRFFTVNSLISLKIENDEVMENHHRLVFSLIKNGLISGLRIDHIDGLADPATYLEKLREKSGVDYVVVEKILEPGEALPEQWPVKGTTGYDFLSLVNNLLTDKSSEEAFTRFYNSLVEDQKSIEQQVRDKKALILYHHMGGELENLFAMLMNSGLVEPEDYEQMRTEDIRTAIAEFLIHCPVYRYYGNRFPLDKEEEKAIRNIFLQLRSGRPDLEKPAALLENIILHHKGRDDENYKSAAMRFYQRCMQFSGPLMAKGVEDTLMYTYNRFIAHNEVGDAPGSFGISPKEFHRAMKERKEKWPLTMNATSTHDTKRGEDVRARLNVLSELPQEWTKAVEEWMDMNRSLKISGAPDWNDEYFIYQTLAGSWPMDDDNLENYRERLITYFTKAFREAKRYTSWTKVNEGYENAVKEFVLQLFDEQKPFLSSFKSFFDKIKNHGIINSLTQLILKCSCPGIPDIYQGCELWDLSLVDPDNRRPVDYQNRKKISDRFSSGKKPGDFINELWKDRNSGIIKSWFTHELLRLRQMAPAVFLKGEYLSLKTAGKYKEHLFAFARKFNNQYFIFVLPLHTAQLEKKQGKEIPHINWEDTRVILPDDCNDDWEEKISGKQFSEGKEIMVKDIFHLPFAILQGSARENPRAAGVLLHISSLPSPFGIGDMGPAAYSFADSLSRSSQRYWQILPLNPVEEGQGYSPYSSTSSFAGNLLFISPEILVRQGLLANSDLPQQFHSGSDKVDFSFAEEIRSGLLVKAFSNYSSGNDQRLKKQFALFLEKENYWLKDFSRYVVLKQMHGGKAWYQWPKLYSLYDHAVLEKLDEEKREEVEFVCWCQFIFEQQWKELKKYCNDSGISVMGDLPFYISYDSADVWSHRNLFELDEEGKILGVAGVPPDAFSSEGQLWGMPVYRWKEHEADDYGWWKKRLKRNMELFDLLRLDHFRAFEAYWRVEAGEHTARNGRWIKGPGEKFFHSIQKALGSLPFVAEDLGEITEEVRQLRENLHLPGMKVLQFAFGENFNQSEHIPHFYSPGFIAYTGTHDNNTLRGWYENDADEGLKKRVALYSGLGSNPENLTEILCRMVYASVANIVILPLQDILDLDEKARMNLPSSTGNNWSWRALPGQVEIKNFEKIKEWAWLYARN